MKIQSNKIKYFIILLIENVPISIFYILNSLFINLYVMMYTIHLLLRVYSKIIISILHSIIINRPPFL